MTPMPPLDWQNHIARMVLAKEIERSQLQAGLRDITQALSTNLAGDPEFEDMQQKYLKDIMKLDAEIAALQATLKP